MNLTRSSVSNWVGNAGLVGFVVVLGGCGGQAAGPREKEGVVPPVSAPLPPIVAPHDPHEMLAGTGGGAGAGSHTVGDASLQPGDGAQAMPCEVSKQVQSNCLGCHGAQLLGGAPMPLVTLADFQRDYVVKTSKDLVGKTMKVHALAAQRLENALNPMPPSGSFSVPEDKPALLAWLKSGSPAAASGDACAAAGDGPIVPDGDDGMEVWDFEPPVATLPGEECFELQMHGGQTPGDTSPYMIEAREYYVQFYFKVPWPANYVGTKAGARYDGLQALHHWLLFTTNRSLSADGTHEEVIGTQLGDSAQLIQGWALGGATVKMPDGVGFELPAPNTMLNVQWHYYNSTGAAVADRSALIVCAAPKESVEHVAAVTWLGTENIAVPPGQMATAKGSCVNDTSEPIHVIAFTPHMHTIGIHMKSEVTPAGSTTSAVVFDKPFSNSSQLQYDADLTLMPGDKIVSTCTFMNPGTTTVGFGSSTDQEMCYQFALSYPAHALDNGVLSLIGASNTCWQFGE